MTAASIINYRVPSAQRQPTTHPKLSVQRNMESAHAMFKPMIERQKTQMFPMRMKGVTTSSVNAYDQMHSALQTTNHKRFHALNLRHSPRSADRGLPKTHILTAKNIHRKEGEQAESSQVYDRVKPLSTDDSKNVITTIKAKPHQSHPLNNVVVSSNSKSLHPYLSSVGDTYKSVKRNFGKAELVDYSSILASSYPD